jgi:hypothetical protein
LHYAWHCFFDLRWQEWRQFLVCNKPVLLKHNSARHFILATHLDSSRDDTTRLVKIMNNPELFEFCLTNNYILHFWDYTVATVNCYDMKMSGQD